MAFLADSVSEENRAKANAFVGFQIGVAFMLSLLIGPIISSRVGLSGLFWVIAILSLIAMLIVLSLKQTKSITYYKLSIEAFKETFTKELLALDFSIFSLHLILAAGFIVMGQTDSKGLMAIGFMLVGLTGGIYGTVQGAFWAEVYGTRFIGAIKALATSLMVIGSAVGPALTGWGIDAGITFPQQMTWYAVYMLIIAMWSIFVVACIWQDLKTNNASA